MSGVQRVKKSIKLLYEGDTQAAHRFRYILLGLDILTILFLVVSTYFYGTKTAEILDVVFGLYLLFDYGARLWIAPKKLSFLIHPLNLADFVALLSFLVPLLGESFAFLRGLRILRLLRSYRLQNKLRQDFDYFRRNEDVIISATNLFVFIFIMTEMVFVSEVGKNPDVKNFLDALYFTIAALTTTGFGDVTLHGLSGRLLSIIIMIFGVSLFLRLVQTLFRPQKIRYVCKECGLFLHESDAVHCKHCGAVLNIPTAGDT
ncbi:MAG: ion transporter [Alphaproteobacteria bacterium]|nr:ion transporter [Alphaproteobacteria bacterium]USO07430.1 MAG: ion transporter [Rhodospirillales bacterium]